MDGVPPVKKAGGGGQGMAVGALCLVDKQIVTNCTKYIIHGQWFCEARDIFYLLSYLLSTCEWHVLLSLLVSAA